MGVVKTIYFPEELNEMLKNEKNVSGLISDLLRDYYRNLQPKELTLEQIQKRKAEIESRNKELKYLEEEEAELLQTEEQRKAKEAEKYKSRIETFKDNVKTFCDVDESEIQGIAEMFDVERWQYETFFDWCKAKQIKIKEEQ